MNLSEILVISYSTTLAVGLFWLTLLVLFVKEGKERGRAAHFIAFFLYVVDTTFACLFIDTQNYCSQGDEQCYMAINVAISTAELLFLVFALCGLKFFDGVLIPLLGTHLLVMGIVGFFMLRGWALAIPIAFLFSSFWIGFSFWQTRKRKREEEEFLLCNAQVSPPV